MLPKLTKRQLSDWYVFHNEEPWGGFRDDLRELAFQRRWEGMLVGSNREMPSPVYPYFQNTAQLTPQEVSDNTAHFAASIEPKPGGGYQWKTGMGPQEVANGNDDNRKA